MNKKEFIDRVYEALRDTGVKKEITIGRRTFRIIDDDGKEAQFAVKQENKKLLYTRDDIENILDGCLMSLEDALMRGDSINIYGYGSIGPHYRKPRKMKHIHEDEWKEVPGSYFAKYNPGKKIRNALRLYAMQLDEDKRYNDMMPKPDYDDIYGDISEYLEEDNS